MQEYPLYWPQNWPRTKNLASSQFKTSLSKALSNVRDELRRFGESSGKNVSNVVISSNVTLGSQNPKDPGVAVYFDWDGISTCIPVDRYQKVEDNLQAIFHCIEAERTKLRHGGINLVRASFQGYAALPAPPKDWRGVLKYQGHNLQEAEKNYKEQARKAHPDNGGTNEQMAILNAAIDSARKELGGNDAP